MPQKMPFPLMAGFMLLAAMSARPSGTEKPQGRPATDYCEHNLMMKRLASVAFFLSSFSPILATTYYVSPAGNDSNAGTQSSPWRTIQAGANNAVPGDTV